MAKKRKKYMVTVNSEAFACSLVTSPAVEETFVAFNEDKPLVEKFADEKKHMVTGVVAIPNRPIYRYNKETGEEYDIVFSAEAIESMAKDFMKNYRQAEVTLQHQEEADGVYLVEQWIKHDPYRDKSAVIGLSEDLPVGSWIQTYYVDSNDVWQRIESGELKGFSLECMLGLEEFESQIDKNNENMNIDEMSFWTKMKEVLAEAFSKKEEAIEPIDMTDLSKEVETELEEQEPTVEPQPTEEAPKVEETVAEEPAVEEPKVEEAPKVEEETKPAEAVNEPQPNPLEDLINSLKEEIKALKESNDGLQKKVKELGKKPSAQPVNTNAKPNGSDIGVNGTAYQAWRSQMREMLG